MACAFGDDFGSIFTPVSTRNGVLWECFLVYIIAEYWYESAIIWGLFWFFRGDYVDNCEKAEGEINNLTFIKHLRTIDNILLNDDRDTENPNILKDQTASSRYYAIDWGLAMDSTEVYKDILTGDISTRMMYFQTCNVVRRPGYLLRKNLSRVTLKQQEIEGIIHEIIEEIPKEWETYSDRTYLEEILSARALSKKIFE